LSHKQALVWNGKVVNMTKPDHVKYILVMIAGFIKANWILMLTFFTLWVPLQTDFRIFSISTINEKKSFNIDGQDIEDYFNKLQPLVYQYPDSARNLAIKAIEIASEGDFADWHIRLLNLVGATWAIQSNYLTALDYYHKALAVSLASNRLERIGDTYNNIGGIHFYARNYNEALSNYLEALSYYEKDGLYDKIAGVHCNIGILYAALNNTTKAMNHFKSGLIGFRNMENKTGQTVILAQIGRTFFRNNIPDSALFYTQKSIDLSEDIQDLYSLSTSLKIKAEILLNLNKENDALEILKKSEALAEKINNQSILCTIYDSYAAIYLKLNKPGKAEFYSKRVIEIAQQINDDQLMVDGHLSLSKIYEIMGRYHQSLEHFKLANEIEKEIMDESKLHKIYNMEIQHLSKDKEIQRLEIERQQFLINKRNTTIYIIILISLFIIVLVASIYYYYANKVRNVQRRRANEAILKATEERSKIALDAEIQERKQLGLELHDRVGPLLSLAKLNVTALVDQSHQANGMKTKVLNSTLEAINEILKEIKQISQNMAPVILIEKGFEAAIRNLVIRLNESNSYKVNLDLFGTSQSLEPYVEHVLYRSILESVNNILHHANGTEINIQIIRNHDDITVMIEDNGIGFDPNILQYNKGLGMRSTRSRIESLKGSIFIDSQPGKGTIITFIIPL
jgi:two-component system, NarL family, sensor kinase